MKGYFVTGTDTGAGKTFVTAALACHARTLGLRVFAFKPIESGCQETEDGRVGSDQEALCAAAGDWQQGPLRGLYRLAAPVAPLMAASAEGVSIDLDLIRRTVLAGSERADLLLVEGAGGWRVPISRETDMAGLAQRLGLPVVVAARATLGTINHSLLTVEAIERDGCVVRALVLSRQPGEDRTLALSNADELRRRWPGLVLLLEADPSVLTPLL